MTFYQMEPQKEQQAVGWIIFRLILLFGWLAVVGLLVKWVALPFVVNPFVSTLSFKGDEALVIKLFLGNVSLAISLVCMYILSNFIVSRFAPGLSLVQWFRQLEQDIRKLIEGLASGKRL